MYNDTVTTPVSIYQKDPIVVHRWNTTSQTIAAALIGIVLFTHWIACIVFLYTMYSIYSALDEVQKNLQQFGVG